MNSISYKKRIISIITGILIIVGIFPIASAENANASISFTIIKPSLNSVHDEQVEIAISRPNSLYQISEVIAKVDDKEIGLQYSEKAYLDRGYYYPGWLATLDLSGLSRGMKTLEITVKDVYGNFTTKQTNFKYSQPPRLTINNPGHFDLTNGRLTIDVEASDLEGEECKIIVYGINPEWDRRYKIAEGMNRINGLYDINLKLHNGEILDLYFEVSNETGGKLEEHRKVYVDDSPFLKQEYHLDGEILDYKDNKILYKSFINDVFIVDLDNSEEELIYSNKKNSVVAGHLTESGAIISVQDKEHYYRYNSLYEYRNKSLLYLGRLKLEDSMKVQGNYLIWNGDIKPVLDRSTVSNELYFKDLVTNQIDFVSNVEGNHQNDLTSNGEVVYASFTENSIYKYHQGITSKVSTDETYNYRIPKFGEQGILYIKYKGDENYLILNENGIEEAIVTSPNGIIDYTKNGEYIAYSRNINGTSQAFLKFHDTEKQLTFSGKSTKIISLNVHGDIILRIYNENRDKYDYYYMNKDSNQPLKLYTQNFKISWKENKNKLYGVIGGSIVQIDTNISLIPVTGVSLSRKVMPVHFGYPHELKATVTPSNATNQKLIWSSSDPSIVSVDQTGAITAQTTGTAIVTVTTQDGNMQASCKIYVPGYGEITPEKPEVNEITERHTLVTGTAEPRARIIVNGQYGFLGSATVSEDGIFSVEIEKQLPGTKLKVVVNNGTEYESETEVVVTESQIFPPKPTINEITDGDTTLTGTTDPRMTVIVKVVKGWLFATATAGEDGQFSVEIPKQPAGTKLTVTVTDEEGRTSDEVEVIVKSTEQPPGGEEPPPGEEQPPGGEEPPPGEEQPPGGEQPIDECFIATAAYGTKFTPSVTLLRNFRDQFLLTNGLGKKFVEFYYKHSPPIAQFIADSEILKFVVRTLLLPAIAVAYLFFHPALFALLLGLVAMMVWQWQRKRRMVVNFN
ncbi:Ig-like domain-containing protein [Caldalkalibacillus mannanilyticus]|uniref:Ig-like domain-containing protein n=1 Tax=Caldalkalibacillus mannanilyticus TaxID=1418 RepID=UPI000469E6DE|nr:Ig-like domain-containing protein [Caldalkalibacillus mannanilyticus]